MRILLPCAVALFTGCAALLPPEEPSRRSEPAPRPAPRAEPARAQSVAVAGLMKTARQDAEAGKLPSAAAALERALRIEPRNPHLWHDLAQVRLKQGEYAQAESVAQRSNSFAGKDNALREQNWRIIAQARTARGDKAGARAALAEAKKVAR